MPYLINRRKKTPGNGSNVTPKKRYDMFPTSFFSFCHLVPSPSIYNYFSSSKSLTTHRCISFAVMASECAECNPKLIYFRAAIIGFTVFSLCRWAEIFYKYCRRRYRSTHTTPPNASTADAANLCAPYDSDIGIYLSSYSTPVTEFGRTYSAMDRDMIPRRGMDLPNYGNPIPPSNLA